MVMAFADTKLAPMCPITIADVYKRQVFEDQASDSLKPTNFDKGKAIYKRHYIYENIRYQVKISRKEFDEQFYVCEYHPEKAYSESDLVKAGKNLVLAGIELFTALCLFTAAIVICFCRKIPS